MSIRPIFQSTSTWAAPLANQGPAAPVAPVPVNRNWGQDRAPGLPSAGVPSLLDFRALDLNNDGVLSGAELASVDPLLSGGRELPLAEIEVRLKVEQAFARDLNRDGYLSGNEITPDIAKYAYKAADGRMIISRDGLRAGLQRDLAGPRPQPAPFGPQPQPFGPQPQPFGPQPQPFGPQPAPFGPPPQPAPVAPPQPDFGPGPAPQPFNPAPQPFNPQPQPFGPQPQPGPQPFIPQPFGPQPGPVAPNGPTGTISLATYEQACGFINYPTQKQYAGDGVLADIERHLPSQYGTQYRDSNPSTWGHETTHGINSDIRNTHSGEGKRVNGFYALNDKGIVLEEPPIRKSAVAGEVPQQLRGFRYGTYVTGQTSWDDSPLYLMDEWSAYINGTAVAIDLSRQNKWTGGNSDEAAGPVEFAGYNFAMAKAVERAQPGYLNAHPQLKAFIAYQALRSFDGYRAATQFPQFQNFQEQKRIVDAWSNDPGTKPLRDFVAQQWGEGFVQRMLQGGGG